MCSSLVIFLLLALAFWQPQATLLVDAFCPMTRHSDTTLLVSKRNKAYNVLTIDKKNIHKITHVRLQASSNQQPEQDTDEILPTDTAVPKTQTQEVIQRNQLVLASTTMVVFLCLVWSMAPVSSSWAIDHPVDFSFLKIPNPLPNADPRYFISGGLCAAASHGVTTPIDVVKTKIQSEPNVFQGQGLWEAATTIVQNDGPQSLLNGLVPTIVGYGLEGALKFGLYESLKPTFVQLLSLDDPTEGFLAASVAAGAVASIVLCPMEQTRIRLVTDPNFADGFLSGLVRITNEEGFEAIFYGFPAMLFKQVPYTMAKQVSFDMFAGFLYTFALQYSLSASAVRTEVEFLAAFLASILACLASHPGDVILTATYKSSASGSFSQVVQKLYQQTGGFNAFFVGIAARFFHVGAIITSQLILYDIIKQLLGLPATGTH